MKGRVMLTPEDAAKFLGTPEEVEETLGCCRKVAIYFDSHQAEWLKEYGLQWVAVSEKKLVAIAPTIHELNGRLDALKVSQDEVIYRMLGEDKFMFLVAA